MLDLRNAAVGVTTVLTAGATQGTPAVAETDQATDTGEQPVHYEFEYTDTISPVLTPGSTASVLGGPPVCTMSLGGNFEGVRSPTGVVSGTWLMDAEILLARWN
jgi:hypothetical protein